PGTGGVHPQQAGHHAVGAFQPAGDADQVLLGEGIGEILEAEMRRLLHAALDAAHDGLGGARRRAVTAVGAEALAGRLRRAALAAAQPGAAGGAEARLRPVFPLARPALHRPLLRPEGAPRRGAPTVLTQHIISIPAAAAMRPAGRTRVRDDLLVAGLGRL